MRNYLNKVSELLKLEKRKRWRCSGHVHVSGRVPFMTGTFPIVIHSICHMLREKR